MDKKFYAVKSGRETGIFNSWDECLKQVEGFSGAVYKSFKTKKQAEDYLSEKEQVYADDTLYAYVDGSFDAAQNRYGCGVVLIYRGEVIKFKKSDDNETLVAMRNVAGEITAAVTAMRYAKEKGFTKLIIHHDYAGIAKWCTGEWKRNLEGTALYKKAFDEYAKQIDIKFVKIAAHSGDKYNDMADALAKESLNL